LGVVTPPYPLYASRGLQGPLRAYGKTSSADLLRRSKMPDRARLPNRRPCVTERIVVGQSVYEASIGFDGEGRPKEIFLSGAKVGTDMAAILDVK
jgi:hypothetical protein